MNWTNLWQNQLQWGWFKTSFKPKFSEHVSTRLVLMIKSLSNCSILQSCKSKVPLSWGGSIHTQHIYNVADNWKTRNDVIMTSWRRNSTQVLKGALKLRFLPICFIIICKNVVKTLFSWEALHSTDYKTLGCLLPVF